MKYTQPVSLLSSIFLTASVSSLYAAAPIAHDDVIASGKDMILELNYLQLNDTDADGDTLTISSVGTPANGTLTSIGNNHYRYTPNTGYLGRDTFTYTVSDGNGGSDTATVTISMNEIVDVEAARTAILANVTSLADPTQPSYLTVWAPTSFSVTNYPGQDESSPGIAAGTLGAGKVIAMPDHQWLNMNSYGGDTSTGTFYTNGITWLAGTTDQSVKIVTMSSGVQTWLTAQGYTNVVLSNTSNLSTDLQGTAVFIPGWLGNNASQATLNTTGDYVRGGGGLFICDYSSGYTWWWNKSKWDIPGNILLREAGIAFTGEGWSSGLPSINRADDQMDIDTIITLFANSGSYSQNEKDLAVSVMQNLLASLHEDDVDYARLVEAFGAASAAITPTVANPVTDSFERTLLNIECGLLAKQDPAEMTAHRAALPVDAGATRVSNATFAISSPPANHATKTIYTPFYAAPGELVTIDFPAALASINLDVRVSHLRSGSGSNSMPVMPTQMINFDVDGSQIQVANPHGGLIQIIVPGNVTWSGTQNITVSGAVEAPFFKLGETTDAQWVAGIRDRGTPFGVLDSDEATLVVDADSWLRTLPDPEAVMTEWNFFCGKVRTFYAYDAGRQLPVHHDYYPAGGVSTYPQSYGRTANLTDSLELKSSAYSLTLHEYGHICDSGNFQFHEFSETSPNMGGKWMQKTARNYSWKQALTVSRVNNYLAIQSDNLWNHAPHYKVHVKGTPFDLLVNEFGPQLIQDTVAAMTAMPSSNFSGSQDKIDEWVRQVSNRTGFNMSNFFTSWQLPPSASVITELSGLPDWMPVERAEETLTVVQNSSVKFEDPSSNDFSYDGGLILTAVGQPSNGAVVDNGDGTFTYTPSTGFTGADSFTYSVTNATGNVHTSTIPVTVIAAANDPKLVSFDGYAEGGNWTTINLEQSYTSMVVVAQPMVGAGSPPLATRIRNASGSSFEVRLDRLDGSSSAVGPTTVRFLVVEKGVYDVATHGIKMEAVKFNSTVTDTGGNFVGTTRDFAYTGYDHYFIPAVFGQVMTSNDTAWSSFWFKAGANRVQLGKHVGEDPNTSRVAETIGYIVMESGSYQLGDYQFQIGVTNYDGYANFGLIGDAGASHSFERFPTIHSAQFASDMRVPWGGSDTGEDGFVAMQSVAPGNSVSVYLAEDTLGDGETATGTKSTSYVLAHYTGDNPIINGDVATALSGEQTLIPVLANDTVSGNPVVTVSQPANGSVTVHSDGTLIYTPNASYTGQDAFSYTVNNGSVQVTAPVSINVIAANPVQSGLVADRFNGISGSSISSLTGNANYPDNPSSSSIWTNVDSGTSVGDSYGHRVYGVVVAPTTGDYTFWIASDDQSQLLISNDSTPANAAVVASVSNYTGHQAWDSNGSQQSAVIPMVAGQAYYLEILHKEGGGGDHVAVAWQGPGFARTLLTTPHIFTAGENAPTLIAAPSNVTVDEGAQSTVVDLSGVYSESDPGDSLTYEIHGNTNSNLVTAVVNGSNLTLSYPSIETGSATITIRATDRINTLVTTSFTVTVNDSNPDSDGDGLLDSWEVANFGNLAAQDSNGDPDGDGLNNAGELAAGTDPNNTDSDGDGASDQLEVTAGSDPNSNTSTPQGLFADLHSWWRFDESAGTNAADLANGNHGTVSGAAFVAGKNGNALQFDGVDDGVLVDSDGAILGTGDFTLTAWVKIDAAAGTGAVIQQREPGSNGYNGEYVLNVNDNGTVTFFIYNNGHQFNITTTTTVNDDQWHHIAAVRDGDDGFVFIDGVQSAQGNGPAKELRALALSIGYDHRDNNKYFAGLIDDVRVYTRALTNGEIGSFSNQAPVVNDATFAVDENAVAGAIGTVTANDPDAGDSLTYSITAGNGSGLFAIDSNTGVLSTTGATDHETASQYVLSVTVSDDGSPQLSDTATITVNVNDVNEAPTADDANGSVAENVVTGSVVTTVSSTDPDAGDSVTYSITGGNIGGAFAIDSGNGTITTAAALDYETTSVYNLTVTATDSGALTDTASVTVTVTNVAHDTDSDNDGYSDDFELAQGSDPNSASSKPNVLVVAQWDFNEAGNPGVTTDVIGGVTGDLLGGAAFTGDSLGRTGQLGDRALDLGGSNGGQRAEITNMTFLQQAAADDKLTISFWQKLDQAGLAMSSFWAVSPSSGDGQRGLQAHTPWLNNSLYYDFGNSSANHRISAPQPSGIDWTAWNHIALVKNGGAAEIWVNGVKIAGGSGKVPLVTDFTKLVIGANGTGGNSLSGDLDDFAFFNAALDQSQIAALAGGAQPDSLIANSAPEFVSSSITGTAATVAAAYTGSIASQATDPDAGDTLTFTKQSGPAWLNVATDGSLTGSPAEGDVGSSVFTVRVTDAAGLFDEATLTVDVTATTATVSTGSASNVALSSATVGYDVTATGGENPTVTVYYGLTDGGTSAGSWDSSQSLGVVAAGAGAENLTGLTDGTTYYYTVSATNSAGTTWGSTGSFTTVVDKSPKLVRTNVSAVSSTTWTSVNLGQNYNSAVIIATPIYPNSSVPPVVTRIRNVSGSSFEVKIDRTDGLTAAVTTDVSIVVVEEGVYTTAEHGVNMEAVKFTSTVTAQNNAWSAEARTYQNSYTNPVVVGQVMSANDADWSVFWCQGSNRTSPPSASALNVGKHVGEDPDTTRADETIGYIVIESGNGSINGVNYTAGLGNDIVQGTGNTSTGYNYSLTGLSTASAAAVSIAGMDGSDGGWAVLYGATPLTSTSLTLAVDEDQLGGTERNHTHEQVGYLVFE
ncbi:hypothetical protein NT6N_20730 [Oceaniferula spumae]|uniref:Staphylococcus aureus surface protein A n=1 Tax=Oceaniferula spumae TaxID=2979115 RepID=A0AAT9FM54_9BACT